MIDFRVIPDDGEPFAFTAGSRDVLLWEKTSKRSFSQVESDPKMTDLYALAYTAARRQNLFTGTPADFEATCELDFTDHGEDPDPTQPAP